MAFHGTPVEVRKNVKSTTWYNGELVDIQGEDIKIRFEDDIWPTRQVPASSVRRCPEEITQDDFDPQVDEEVEVLVSASESNPSGWALGQVKTIKNSFYFINFSGTQPKGKQDLIVEKSALRPQNTEQHMDLSTTIRRCLPVDPELHMWIRSQDSSGCLSHVQSKCHLLVANCTNVETGSENEPEVLLVGGEREVILASKLLQQIHFKYQIEMQRFHEQREQLMERLSSQRQWYSTQFQEVFDVDQNLVGKLIGKKGDNIKDIRERHGVQVYIPDAKSNRASTTVTITGQSEEAVKAARDELEYIHVNIPVESDQVGWILGKGYQTITDIARKTELHHARYDDTTKTLELCGLRHQVEDAKLLISVHREYLPVYQDMDEEQDAIQRSFDQLDGVASAKGKGKKGKDKDKGPDVNGSKGKGKDEDGDVHDDRKGGKGKSSKGKGDADEGGKKGRKKGDADDEEEGGKKGRRKGGDEHEDGYPPMRGKDGKSKDAKGGKDGKDEGKDGKGKGAKPGKVGEGKNSREGKSSRKGGKGD